MIRGNGLLSAADPPVEFWLRTDRTYLLARGNATSGWEEWDGSLWSAVPVGDYGEYSPSEAGEGRVRFDVATGTDVSYSFRCLEPVRVAKVEEIPGLFCRVCDLLGNGFGGTAANVNVGSLGNATFDVTGGGVEDEWTLAGHGLQVGDRVQFSAVGTGAEPYAVSTDYWVVAVPDANTFQLSASKEHARAGTVLEGTGSDSAGVWTIARQTTEFSVDAQQDEVLDVSRLGFYAEDNASMTIEAYGGAISLTNGIRVYKERFGVKEALDGGLAVFSNGDLERLTGNMLVDNSGSSNECVSAALNFEEAFGGPLRLRGDLRERLIVQVDDDLSGLVHHYFTAFGKVTIADV